MEITFVRRHGPRDHVYVTRDDGSEVAWPFPSYGGGLPHDLVHLVVEREFEVRRGLWGLIGEGVDIGRVNAVANRVGGRDKYQELGDLRELMFAEHLATAPWGSAETSDRECLAAIANASAGLDVALDEARDLERVRRVRARLRELAARWRALGPNESVRLSFERAPEPEPSGRRRP